MAHHKSAKKANRQSVKKNIANKYYGKTTRNAMKKLRLTTEKPEAEKSVPGVISMIDRLAKRNIIHKNKASNLKSAIMKRMAAM